MDLITAYQVAYDEYTAACDAADATFDAARNVTHANARAERRATLAASAAYDAAYDDALRRLQRCRRPLTEAVADLIRLGHRYTKARASSDDIRHDLDESIRQAVGQGVSEVVAARLAGVDRMTVRKVLGKR